MTRSTRLAVLISGSGRSLENLAQVIAAGELDATIALVISSRAKVKGVERAKQLGLPCVVIRPRDVGDAAEHSRKLFAVVREAGAELLCLMGFLSKLIIPRDFERKVLNIHPALLPDFGGQGMYGERVHAAVIAARRRESGCTVHWCDDEYDHGEIVLQRRCAVLDGDTVADLAARVFAEEILAYPEALRRVLGP